MIFDTHTHIYLQEFDNDRAEVMERASQAGVSRMMLPNVDTKTIYDLKQTLSAYPCCIAAMGLHPTSVNDDYREALNTVCLELESGIYRAVGEVG
ncbi:MAG: TatD family hydrolase, partial [Bacteroidales bacterium]